MDVAVRDQMVADYGKAYLDLMLSYPQLRDVLCWGMCDRYSWLNGFRLRARTVRVSAARRTTRDFRPKLLPGVPQPSHARRVRLGAITPLHSESVDSPTNASRPRAL